MSQKSPHERRMHSMRVAGVLTALMFMGWVTTLGLGATSTPSQVATGEEQNQTASALQGLYRGNQLVVSTTTDN